MKWKQKMNTLIRDEPTVYTWLCIGIVYTLIFWTYLNSILCIMLAGYWLIRSKKSFDFHSWRSRLMILFSSLYLVFLVGMFYSSNKHEGLFRLQEKTAILFFPLIFGSSRVLTKTMIKKICLHFAIATSIAAFIILCLGFMSYMETGHISAMMNQHLTIFIDVYPYLMGLFSLFSIIILFERLPDNHKEKKWILSLITFLSIVIMMLSVRVIIACWFLTILFFIFKYVKALRYRLLISVTMIIFVCVAVATIPYLKNQWRELNDFSKDNTIELDQDRSLGKSWGGKSIRIAIWKCSEDLVRKYWLWGVGTGDIQDSLQGAYEKRKFYFASRYNQYNSHNQFIQILIGHGIIGLSVLLVCIALPFFTMKNNPNSLVYFLFLLLFFVISFTEVILDTNKGIIWYSFFNSIFAFQLTGITESNQKLRPKHN